MFTLTPYTIDALESWDNTVREARNGTFLLERAYMDYHADRFTDRSLVIRDEKGRVTALFAAAVRAGQENGETVTAHAGLTYGGLVMTPRLTAPEVLEIMEAVAEFYRSHGFKRLVYHPVPHIFHRLPAEDDVYALFRLGGHLSGCMLSSSIRKGQERVLTNNRKVNIHRAERDGVSVKADTDWAAFYAVLKENLSERHKSAPVHSYEELTRLAGIFTENIKLVTARSKDGELLAGTVLYVTDTCTHTQYIASTPEGRRLRAVDLLLEKVITQSLTEWVDLGTSCLEGGKILDAGLINQKYGFGLRGTAFNTYTLDL